MYHNLNGIDMLNELKKIECELIELHNNMLFEEKVLREELRDRLDKCLTGVESIEHFNQWMIKFKLYHLVIM